MVQRVLDHNVIDRRSVVEYRSGAWRQLVAHLDMLLVFATLTVSALGVLMVYSATRSQLLHNGESPQYWLKRQALWSLLGVLVMVGVVLVDYHRLEELGYLFYGAVLAGLLAVFAVGRSALGAQRWFQIGPIQLQPSAFAVLGVVLAVAAYCHRHQEAGLTPRRVAALVALGAVPALLVIKQPDLGSGIVILVTLSVMLVISGVRARYLTALAALAVVAVVAVVSLGLLKSFQTQRLTTFLNPNANTSAAYNLRESKIAVAAGGVAGKGLFKGSQTDLGYVPEQFTDFIFTAVGEQLGFAGAASLLGLFGLMVWRLLRAAQLARDHHGRLLCAGVLALIAFSVFQSVGMTIGIMPITGIPLPFVSYGGSATVAFFAAIGLALNVNMRRYG